MKEPTVYIIDDDEPVRDSIKELVESIDLRAEIFSNAQAFLETCTTEKRGCLVLDVRMPKMSGLAMQDALSQMGVRLPIIFISGHGEIGIAVEAMKAGATDFIQKPYHEQNLLDSIQNALGLDAQIRKQTKNDDALAAYSEELTPREREVMAMLAQGHVTKYIADPLAISPRTVEAHRQHILHKYNVTSLTQLMRLFNESKSELA